MVQPMPQAPIKPKYRSAISITLAIGLHLLVAIVIYFLVFDNNTPTTKSDNIEPPKNVPMITEARLDATHNAKTQPIKSNVAKADANPDEQTNKRDAKSVETTKDHPVAHTAKKPQMTPQDSKPSNHDDTTVSSSKVAIKNTANTAKNLEANQKSLPKSQLKKSQEYETLENDIDQDSEQLAKLIEEVKKRNQQQIEQQQSDMADAQITPKSVPNIEPPPQEPALE